MRLFRNIFLSVLVTLAVAVITGLFWLRDRYVVPIITYHHISEKTVGFDCLNNVTPARFAWQMKFMSKHHYNVISFDDYIQGVKKGAAFARNTVVIQFDDGYADNYTHAFPILKLYDFPAIVFLVSNKIGDKGFLTWEQVRMMEKDNFYAGAHTRMHPYLPDIPIAAAKEEIEGSKKDIEFHLGHSIDYFAYPAGGFNDDIAGLVRQAGYKAACTTNRGRDRFNRSLYELNRIRIKDSDGAFSLWAKLSGYYNLYRENRFSDKSSKTFDGALVN